MFADLQSCGRFAWGAAALTHLYEQLSDASLAHTKQLVGYLTLLQVQNYFSKINFLLWSYFLFRC